MGVCACMCLCCCGVCVSVCVCVCDPIRERAMSESVEILKRQLATQIPCKFLTITVDLTFQNICQVLQDVMRIQLEKLRAESDELRSDYEVLCFC